MKKINLIWKILVVVLAVLICFSIYVFKKQTTPKENISEIKINLNQFFDMTSFKEKENIDKAIEIEKTLNTRGTSNITFGNYRTIEYDIIYKNGKSITKIYKNIYPVDEIFKELIESEEYKKQTYDIYNEKIYESDKITLFLNHYNNRRVDINDMEKIIKIIDLLQEEYLLNDINEYINDEHINNIVVEFDNDFMNISNYILNSTSEKVIETLMETGVYDTLMILPDDIDGFSINNGNNKIYVKDKEIIKIILDLSLPYSTGKTVFTYEGTTLNGDIVYGTFLENNVPEEISKLFE